MLNDLTPLKPLHRITALPLCTMNFTHFAAICSLLCCSTAYCGPLFRCESNGRLEFQDKPCLSAKQQVACLSGDARLVYSKELLQPCKQLAVEPGEYEHGRGVYDLPSRYRNRSSNSGTGSPGSEVTVRGYVKSTGVQVQGYTRRK